MLAFWTETNRQHHSALRSRAGARSSTSQMYKLRQCQVRWLGPGPQDEVWGTRLAQCSFLLALSAHLSFQKPSCLQPPHHPSSPKPSLRTGRAGSEPSPPAIQLVPSLSLGCSRWQPSTLWGSWSSLACWGSTFLHTPVPYASEKCPVRTARVSAHGSVGS